VSQNYFISTNPIPTGMESNRDLREKGLENILLSHSKVSNKYYSSAKYMLNAVLFCVCVCVCVCMGVCVCVCVLKLRVETNYIFIIGR
jgi:hypothetical protein